MRRSVSSLMRSLQQPFGRSKCRWASDFRSQMVQSRALTGWRDHELSRASASSSFPHATRALLISNSTLFGGSYFGHCGENIQKFLSEGGVREVLFVPYSLHDYDKYFGNAGAIKYDEAGQPVDHTGRPRARLQELGFSCTSIHNEADPDPEPKARMVELGFNVSMEENREQRIRQYTDEEEDAVAVVGLREGTLLEVNAAERYVRLHGRRSARVFWPRHSEAEEYQPGSRMDVLLKAMDASEMLVPM
eukprot:TRINITY_DN3786_c0_g1_i1.p1 TRINITY_DN3786_c0_g1~~TRINITY_DN3786_c0_g1_i1.p1  ORF type:complete len:248 (+),score=58.33 TRINITY_DN3786_c0_g1_i1:150-893(+)